MILYQARKRKLSVDLGNRRATKAKSASYEPKVSAKQRVKEFGEETFRARDDGIFCEACKEGVAVPWKGKLSSQGLRRVGDYHLQCLINKYEISLIV